MAGTMDKPHGLYAPNPFFNTTIRDVAQAAGVSVRTVSRVLNASPKVGAETRRHVTDTMTRLDFRPSLGARALAAGRSYLLGVVQDDPNARTISVFQRGIVDVCSRSGYELLVHPVRGRGPGLEADIEDFVRRTRIDGLILLPPISEVASIPVRLRELGVPVVGVLACEVPGYEVMTVGDERDAAEQVARHLIALGHKKLGIITGPMHLLSGTERLGGFRDTLEQHGIALPPAYITHGDYSFESGLAAARALLELGDPPTAIFASNDNMAAGVLKVASERKVAVPADLSVVGFDDSDIAVMLTPTLTTVHRPSLSMAQNAARQLLAMISKGATGEPGAHRVSLNLIARSSSGPAPN